MSGSHYHHHQQQPSYSSQIRHDRQGNHGHHTSTGSAGGAPSGHFQVTTTRPIQPHTSTAPPLFRETFFGFIKTRLDALLCVEACIAGELCALNVAPVDLTALQIRSGTVIVFAESTNHMQMMRWRVVIYVHLLCFGTPGWDLTLIGANETQKIGYGGKWSPSRINDQFLLYREVETITKSDRSLLSHPRGASPETNETTRFSNVNARPNSRVIPSGFAKRTISIVGSDGKKYRVISYFFPKDVEHLYTGEAVECGLSAPCLLPEFCQYVGRVRARITDAEMEQLAGTNEETVHEHTEFPNERTQSVITATLAVPAPRQPSVVRVSPPSALSGQQAPTGSSISPQKLVRNPTFNPYGEIWNPLDATVEQTIYRTQVAQIGGSLHPVNLLLEVKEYARKVPECGCGGLGKRKHTDVDAEKWTRKPVWLAPLQMQF
ncbi:hypothetical protein BC830DRAFT_1077662 [Chytriomyces sp. MP71]|nr:hypothetical protein BC830DRAFT_1077662 [Chytriomyces sp. MP71]